LVSEPLGSHSLSGAWKITSADLLRRPDPAFGGASMLEVMLQGTPGITQARAHLLAQITR
jgi:hypothetical protein